MGNEFLKEYQAVSDLENYEAIANAEAVVMSSSGQIAYEQTSQQWADFRAAGVRARAILRDMRHYPERIPALKPVLADVHVAILVSLGVYQP